MELDHDGETLVIHYELTDADIDSVIRGHQVLDRELQKCGCGKLEYWFPEKDLADALTVYLTNEGAPQCAACSARRGEEISWAAWQAIQDILTQSPAKFLAAASGPTSGPTSGPSGLRDSKFFAQIGGIATRLITRALEREPRSYEVLSRLRPAMT